MLLGFYEFCASLKLAVVLIFSSAFVLGWATFVEAAYGTEAVHFGVYDTWWFIALHAALAVNIFCAASIRFPWKRHQTGFVITHIGLLTLLYGSIVQHRGGIDAQMPIKEHGHNRIAYEDSQHFLLAIHRDLSPGQAVPSDKNAELISIPFAPGPFNWSDYRDMSLGQSFFQLGRRDRGVIYDDPERKIKLEVLDFYANAEKRQLPYLKMEIGSDSFDPQQSGRPTKMWQPMELSAANADKAPDRGERRSLGGGTVNFWMADSPEETAAFLERPDVEASPTEKTGDEAAKALGLGSQGQVVLRVDGKTFRFRVDEKEGKGRFPLEGTDREVEVMRFLPNEGSPVVDLRIYRTDKTPGRMLLVSNRPAFIQPDETHGVLGSYWFDFGNRSAEERMSGGRGARVDLLQGTDQKIYYRTWNGSQITASGLLPTERSAAFANWLPNEVHQVLPHAAEIDAFKMPFAALKLRVLQAIPSAKPSTEVEPLPFDRRMTAANANRAAKVRLTVDGKSEEFWVMGFGSRDDMLTQLTHGTTDDDLPIRSPEQRRIVRSDNTAICVMLPVDRVDVGFNVYLREFQKKDDPGTMQASHYGSRIDFTQLDEADYKKEQDSIAKACQDAFSSVDRSGGGRLSEEGFAAALAALAKEHSDLIKNPAGARASDADFDHDGRIELREFTEFVEMVSSRGRKNVTISMNAPVDFTDPISGRSFRLFQEGFQPVGEDYFSTLTVNYDPSRFFKLLGSVLICVGIFTMFYMRAYFFKPQRKVEPRPAASRPVSPVISRG